MIANPSHVGAGAFADFPEMRSVKTSLGEQFTGYLEYAITGGGWAPRLGVRRIRFHTVTERAFHNTWERVRALTKGALRSEPPF
jgi:hypothetical protein